VRVGIRELDAPSGNRTHINLEHTEREKERAQFLQGTISKETFPLNATPVEMNPQCIHILPPVGNER